MTLGDIIKEYRTSHKMSMDAFAEKSGISKAYISILEKNKRPQTGKPVAPSIQCIKQAADGMDMDFNVLFSKIDSDVTINNNAELKNNLKTYDDIFPLSVKKFPLLGEIACGEPIFANEDRESYVLAGTDINADFCLKAKGDSMIGARILDGDIVFIKKMSIVDNGDIAAVAVDDEVLLKRFEYAREENILALHSENPRYKTIRYTGEQLDHIRVLGKAVAFQSDII